MLEARGARPSAAPQDQHPAVLLLVTSQGDRKPPGTRLKQTLVLSWSPAPTAGAERRPEPLEAPPASKGIEVCL